MIIFNTTKFNRDYFCLMGKILDRIQQIASNEGISIGAMERAIGASKGVLSRAINNGTDIQVKWLEAVVENYPTYSPQWLLTGVGDMIVSSVSKQNMLPVAIHTDKQNEGIPLIPISAMAGAFKGEQSILEYECERYVIPSFKGADFLIPVTGDSMIPTFHSGDIVACRKVDMSKLFFQWNKSYVLDTNQGPIIKRVKPGSDKEHVLIVSDNQDYYPFELEYNDIYNIALVVGLIRLE